MCVICFYPYFILSLILLLFILILFDLRLFFFVLLPYSSCSWAIVLSQIWRNGWKCVCFVNMKKSAECKNQLVVEKVCCVLMVFTVHNKMFGLIQMILSSRNSCLVLLSISLSHFIACIVKINRIFFNVKVCLYAVMFIYSNFIYNYIKDI